MMKFSRILGALVFLTLKTKLFTNADGLRSMFDWKIVEFCRNFRSFGVFNSQIESFCSD